ncbi:homeobox protein LBX [Paragonimus westermani]|uniref:Homeobox protein LBX n=1 Tax=Paragonimus westermani TaxID=34504 RepID=A0A5J4P0B6_9TREM|nr:homeobox protein LBX [Paragonimus westermani]
MPELFLQLLKDCTHLLEMGTAANLDVACLVRGTRASKRRKTRTTFSNSQLSELEHNFNRQKYLTPADRDRIAKQLGLSNTQVITWFQNRRAKLKREAEELERDILAARQQEQQKVLGRSAKYLSDDWRSQRGSPVECESVQARPREHSGSVEEQLPREDWDEHATNAVVNVSSDKGERQEVIRQSVHSIERNLNCLLKVKKSASETVWSPADEL